jgi:peptidoglycan-associated lipoprotein
MYMPIFRKSLSFFFCTLLLMSTFCANAQLKYYKKGLSNFENGFYELAIKEFVKVKDIDDSQVVNLNFKIAEAYRLTNRWLESIPYYEKSIEMGSKNPESLFYSGYALKANQEYVKAKQRFEAFLNLKTDFKVLNERALRELTNLQLIESLRDRTSEKVFGNLSALNTKGIEFSGQVLNGYMVYSASVKDKTYSNGLPYLGIVKAKINADFSKIDKPEPFSENIFDADRNEANPSFTPDGKTMVFARGNTGKRRDISPDVDLYLSRLLPNGVWTTPAQVSASDSAAWDGSPAFSRDGKTLYFSSNRTGGSGGLDIYRVNMDASGRFGNPQNMGKVVNTAGDEMFPFVAPDGKLYFASDGHPGLGKLDLFVAVRSGGKISVENMGLPYNSSMDDFGLSVDDSGLVFFTSNREGGVGNDDIYFYQPPAKPEDSTSVIPPQLVDKPKVDSLIQDLKIINYHVAGRVFSETGASLDSVRVRILKIEGGLEETVMETFTDRTGAFGPQQVFEDTDYLILVDKPNYLTKRVPFSMFGRAIPALLLRKAITDTTFYENISLEKLFLGKTFRLENIYYDLDKFDIRPDAALELDKLVQVLNDNPEIKIELGSHTDSRSSNVYNDRLSQKRAEAAINYLFIKGINKDRLTAKGYGESELLVPDAKTEDEHQTNRRTEFKVMAIEKK